MLDRFLDRVSRPRLVRTQMVIDDAMWLTIQNRIFVAQNQIPLAGQKTRDLA
jgi:hypothetical protein